MTGCGGPSMASRIRRPVRVFCRQHGRYIRVDRHTWMIDTERPSFRYYLNRGLYLRSRLGR